MGDQPSIESQSKELNTLNLQPLIVTDADVKRVKRKLKTAILTRYVNEEVDLFQLIDNKQEWYKNCRVSLFDKISNKEEKAIYN